MKANYRSLFACAVFAAAIVLGGCSNPTGSDGTENGGSGGETTPEDYESPTIGVLRYVPAGSFQRDGTETNISVITRPFRMSEHLITREQFLSVMGQDPSDNTGSSNGADSPNDPVQRASWYYAIAFANKLSLAEGLTPVYSVDGIDDWADLPWADIPHGSSSNADWDATEADWEADGYRLPTEMEWMWAAMAADQDAQPGALQNGINRTGYDKPFAGYDGTNSIGDYAWYADNSDPNGTGRTTQPVGTRLPNELELYDMSGNVFEWNWDWSTIYPAGTVTDYRGPDSGTNRIRRGGSWFNDAGNARIDRRSSPQTPQNRNAQTGFRLVRR